MPAAVVMSIGIVIALIGALMLLTYDSGSDTAWTLLAVGSPLALVGYLWLKRISPRWKYQIQMPMALWEKLATIAMCAALPVGLMVLSVFIEVRILMFFGIVLAPICAKAYGATVVTVVMNRVGVKTGSPLVPWGAIAQIVAVDREDGSRVRIGLRLRPGAQLPDGVPPPEPGLEDPDADDARTFIKARDYKLPELAAAINRFAPPHVQLVVRTPAGERSIER
jgi:hypothetical protein